jgi:hypothetical protein
MFFIYTLAGIGGWITSATFTPYQVSCPWHLRWLTLMLAVLARSVQEGRLHSTVC